MPNLLDCYIGGNKFSGNLPTSIRSFTKLHTFYAYTNQLTGSIPDAFNSMKSLLHLNISGNRFEGPLPTGMGLFSNLREIDVSGNKMSGTLPNSYAPLSKLRTFAISNNQFSGTLPAAWNAWDDIEYFRLSYNLLTGIVPDEFNQWPWIIETKLDNNQFCGPIPNWMVNAPAIHTMALAKNNWACEARGELPDYCEDKKKFCDFEAAKIHGCSSKEIEDARTCTFVTTPPPTTTTARGIGANVFTEHLVYSNSKCGLHTIVLHDIAGEVGCADEAWMKEKCGLWYSFNRMTHHCECVEAGQKCKKESETGSNVYKIEDLSPDHSASHHRLENTRPPSVEPLDFRIILVSVFLGVLISALLVAYLTQRAKTGPALEEVLMDENA